MASSSLLDSEVTFADLGAQLLDRRITKAIAKLQFVHPTLVQSKCIPLALDGKDVLARARTGSGKTFAYAIPLVQKLLTTKADSNKPAVRAVVLVPTRELCTQVFHAIQSLLHYCRDVISIVQLGNEAIELQKARLSELPDIVVSTPTRLVEHIGRGNIKLKQSLQMLVIDEADLILSFGYEEDMRAIVAELPKICQGLVMSATLNEQVDELKKLVLHSPAILKLEEPESAGQLSQFYLKTQPKDKFLLIYALLKLRLLQGKAILFVNDVDRCYRLKLFLEQFSIDSAVLNAELPQNSRDHIIQSFNKGLFDYLIATDMGLEQDEDETDDDEEEEEEDGEEENEEKTTSPDSDMPDANDDDESEEADTDKKKQKEHKAKQNNSNNSHSRKTKDFGVSRGIDFKDVKTVVNFDFPVTARSYIHRVGRTARGGATGTALSFVEPREERLLGKVEKQQKEMYGVDSEAPEDAVIKPLVVKLSEVEGFRYRVDDVLRAVTRIAIKEARLKEIKREIVHSDKLKSYFEDNPKDLQVLKHDKALRPSRVQSHLKHVPKYLLPPSLQPNPVEQAVAADNQEHQGERTRSRRGGRGMVDPRKRKREDDPLQSFQFEEGENANKKAAIPKLLPDVESLKPTSGRKLWKIRHNKKLKRPERMKKQIPF